MPTSKNHLRSVLVMITILVAAILACGGQESAREVGLSDPPDHREMSMTSTPMNIQSPPPVPS